MPLSEFPDLEQRLAREGDVWPLHSALRGALYGGLRKAGLDIRESK